MKYITNPKKTEENLITAIGCEKDSAFHEMIAVKMAYGKDTGRQFIHFVQSFAPYDKVTPEIAHEIAVKLSDKLKGFQVEMATHTDTEHIHTHFIVNTVNYENGLKWKKSAKDLQDMKDYSDQLCREYGLLITHKQKDAYKKGGEFRSEQQGQSWKHELYLIYTIDKLLELLNKAKNKLAIEKKQNNHMYQEKDIRSDSKTLKTKDYTDNSKLDNIIMIKNKDKLCPICQGILFGRPIKLPVFSKTKKLGIERNIKIVAKTCSKTCSKCSSNYITQDILNSLPKDIERKQIKTKPLLVRNNVNKALSKTKIKQDAHYNTKSQPLFETNCIICGTKNFNGSPFCWEHYKHEHNESR